MRRLETIDRSRVSDIEVRRQLDRILGFPELQASDRRREMLNFIVEEALAGRASGLKATTIAIAVFDRGPDFDQQADPVVRLEARKLRRDLDNYYAGAGRDDPVRIDIPKGRYVPTFDYQRDPPGEQGDPPTIMVKAPGQDAAEPLRLRRAPWRFAVTCMVVVAIVAIVAVLFLLETHDGAVEDSEPATSASLLVEGFRALDKSENTALIAEGVTQKLVTDLLGYAHLRVYFIPVAVGAGGTQRTVADPPATQFAMSGTVERNGEVIVISARLVRTDDDQLLWTESFTQPTSAKSLMQVEQEVATRIAMVVGQQYGIIQNVVLETALASDADPSMDSYICVSRALIYRRTIEQKDYETTRRCLEAAVLRDPDYADAWAMLAHLRFDAARFGYEPELSRNEGFYSAKAAASRALVIDPKNVEALKVLSFVEEYLGNFDAAISVAERAVVLNPNAPDALANLGNRLTTRGRFEEGVPILKRALDRSVKPVPFYYQMIAVDHMMRSEWSEMLDAASHAVADNSGPSYALMAIANAGLGNSHLARKNLDAMAERRQIFADDPRAAFERYRLDPTIVDALVDGLAMARAVASESE